MNKANQEILKILSKCLEKHPSLRFNQALIALDVVMEGSDDFFTLSEDILKRVEKAATMMSLHKQYKITPPEGHCWNG